jgi:predicted aconitase
MGIDPELAGQQEEFAAVLESMGAKATYTCTPHLAGNRPGLNEHIAWGETAAICFANSVLGARTNREGGASSLAAALTGRAPAYGLHLDQCRAGEVLVQVEAPLSNEADYGDLGYLVGGRVGTRIPVFSGIPADVSEECLLVLASALPAAGPVSLYHVIGVTAEAPTLGDAFHGREPAATLRVTSSHLQATRRMLQKGSACSIAWVYIGCPHATLGQLREVAELLEGARVSPSVTLWVGTSRAMVENRESFEAVAAIERAGGLLMSDTCPVVTSWRAIAAKRGFRSMATNSAKMAHYFGASSDLTVLYSTTSSCVKAAISGRWG